MRIVIDMQGAQTGSRFRGIGRYTMSFVQAVVRNRGEHEIILALSGLFPDTIEPIRAAFDGLLPQENIRVWHAPGPVCGYKFGNEVRYEIAELIREAFLLSLQPDVIHVSSLFEGYGDDAVASIGRFDRRTPVSVAFYDLIPLLNPNHYLTPDPRFEQYYRRKLDYLRQASRFLAISEFARHEGLTHIGAPESQVVNVSTAIEPRFHPVALAEETASQLRQKFGLTRPFALYTGGADERKNLPRLIQAWVSLPPELRRDHHLLFAGKMPDGDIARFRQIAHSSGMKPDELLFTGYVSDEELVQLYNLCALYVFPSWHEGFGLPALEAMACGAPVIGANTSSLPEVIGLDEALFDPQDVSAITARIRQALTDKKFRDRLRTHGLQRAKLFSWDETAKRAIAAWESIPAGKPDSYLDTSLAENRFYESLVPYVSKQVDAGLVDVSACLALNQQVGIERQLLLDVSELCQRDAATGVQRVVRSYFKWLLQSPPAGFRVEPVYATRESGYRYARGYTQRFLGQSDAGVTDDVIRWQRGDVFFGLDMQHHVQLEHRAFYQQLRQEGVTVKFLVYDLLPIQLADLFRDSNAGELHEQWLAMVAATDGAVCISRATSDALTQWIDDAGIYPAPGFQNTWVHIGADIEGSSPSQGVPPGAEDILAAIRARQTFLCVATLEPRKGQQQILDAMEQLWARGAEANLVLVGQQGWKVEALAERIRNHPEQGTRLFWLQGISDEYLQKVYAASTCLIAASINEGFGLPLIEAARHGIPVIARDIPVFREVADDAAFYFSGDTAAALAEALQDWLGLHAQGQHPKSSDLHWSTWQQSAEKLKHALIGQNHPRRQLLVDISELVQRDTKSGIQRVVRSIIKEWLANPPAGFRIEPVYATLEPGYRYARSFVANFMNWPHAGLADEPIDYAPGDIFFGLGFQPQVQVAQRGFYQHLRRQGVRVTFLVYDLLCVQLPQYSVAGGRESHARWLDVIGEGDGAVCISSAVAHDLNSWLAQHGPSRLRPFTIDWFHLGADVDNSQPSRGLSSSAQAVLDQLGTRPSFLMVGTLEPRKGYTQVLEAFERLWREGVDVNLVIVGKQGGMLETLIERLRSHPERDRRLFWLEGISDEYLEKIYTASTCLIAASYGEGFGLPLIEAAQHRLSIIARDIPVFREVAGEHAYYFQAETPDDLAQVIQTWLGLYRDNRHPTSDEMPWLTWQQSAQNLMELLVDPVTTRLDGE